MTKILVRAVAFVLLVAVALLGISYSLNMLNYPSDVAVVLGTLGLVLSVLVPLMIGIRASSRCLFLSGILIAASLSGAACQRIGAGYVGIVISQAGDNRGVNEIPVTTGWVFYNPASTDLFEYPTFMQSAKWEGPAEEITFATADQMRIAVDMSIGYQLDASKVPAFYVKFRNDQLDAFTHGYMRNLAREKFDGVGGKYKIDAIMGDNSAFLTEVRAALQASLDPLGVRLEQFGLLAAPRPPEQVIAMINAKVAATQLAIQKENELRSATADAMKEIARTEGYAKTVLIRADAEAEGNRKVAASLTPGLIELRALEKWNGVLPTMTSSAIPFVNVK